MVMQVTALHDSRGKLMMVRKSTKARIVLQGECNVELSPNRNITKVKQGHCSPSILKLFFFVEHLLLSSINNASRLCTDSVDCDSGDGSKVYLHACQLQVQESLS